MEKCLDVKNNQSSFFASFISYTKHRVYCKGFWIRFIMFISLLNKKVCAPNKFLECGYLNNTYMEPRYFEYKFVHLICVKK